jgi:hypothetical protein
MVRTSEEGATECVWPVGCGLPVGCGPVVVVESWRPLLLVLLVAAC